MEGRSASSFYAILGVPRTFTDDQLKRQYRLLALKYHPDRNRGNEDEAAEKFKEIQEAWTTLSNPAEREAYDVELNERERHRMPRGRAQPSASGRSGSSDDTCASTGGGGSGGMRQSMCGARRHRWSRVLQNHRKPTLEHFFGK